ncbi:MAG: MBL fold metallo-hydrolase [Monoglobales bacterium]
MKIKYFGTAAAEGVPAFFCECDICEDARKKGGRNIRTRPQALIDDKILIDFGPDTYLHIIRDGLPLHKIKTCIITHSHGDHFVPKNIVYRATPIFAKRKTELPFYMYGTKIIKKMLFEDSSDYAEHLEKTGELVFTTTEPFVTFEAEGYKITPLKARHGAEEATFYMIEKGGKAMLYAHDSGIFPDETWEYFEKTDVRFDFISLDCTNIMTDSKYSGHMGLKENVTVRDRLEKMGLIDKNTVCFVNHFSHNGLKSYDELVPIAKELGFDVSYDGLEVEF